MKHLETPEEIRQLRDKLAGHAVTGLMSRNWSSHRGTDFELFEVWASSSYAIADKMLIARAAQPVIETSKLAILATFTHEILMGAISDSDLQHRAQLALETAGLKSLNDVVALTQSVVEPVRLTNLDITKIGVGGNTEWSIDFARAIEKAHGITTDNILSQTVKTTPKPAADHI